MSWKQDAEANTALMGRHRLPLRLRMTKRAQKAGEILQTQAMLSRLVSELVRHELGCRCRRIAKQEGEEYESEE